MKKILCLTFSDPPTESLFLLEMTWNENIRVGRKCRDHRLTVAWERGGMTCPRWVTQWLRDAWTCRSPHTSFPNMWTVWGLKTVWVAQAPYISHINRRKLKKLSYFTFSFHLKELSMYLFSNFQFDRRIQLSPDCISFLCTKKLTISYKSPGI